MTKKTKHANQAEEVEAKEVVDTPTELQEATDTTENKLTQEELLAIEKIVSPLPEKDKDGKLIKNKDNKIKVQIPSKEDVQKFNDVLSHKQVDVGIVIQLAGMFVNNLQSFTIGNLQGLMDTIEIQKRIVSRVATESGLDIDKIVKQETQAFTAELAEQMAQKK